jgi:hypothetical protein
LTADSQQQAVSLSVISYLLSGRSVAMSRLEDMNDFCEFYAFYDFYDFNGLNDLPFTVHRLPFTVHRLRFDQLTI